MRVYYTEDGSTPTIESTLYVGPVLLGEDEIFKAIAVKGNCQSAVIVVQQQEFCPDCAEITFKPAAGSTVQFPSAVFIQANNPNALVYYTLDGSAPTNADTLYSGPLTLASGDDLRAIAYCMSDEETVDCMSEVFDADYTESDEETLEFHFVCDGPQDEAGVFGEFAPNGVVNDYHWQLRVERAADWTFGRAEIYETDSAGLWVTGQAWATQSPVQPVELGGADFAVYPAVFFDDVTQLNSAYGDDFASFTGGVLYTLDGYGQPFIPLVGYFHLILTVVEGAETTVIHKIIPHDCCESEFRYTLDGSEPTFDSPVYETPITLPAGGTLKAIAVSDFCESDVLTVSAPECGECAPIAFVTSVDVFDGPDLQGSKTGYNFELFEAVTVTALGRWITTGNTQTHEMTLHAGANGSGDPPLASVTVNTSGATGGEFLYADLASPVALEPGIYSLYSNENDGTDAHYGPQCEMTTTAVGEILIASDDTENPSDAGQGWPVSFQYCAGTIADGPTDALRFSDDELDDDLDLSGMASLSSVAFARLTKIKDNRALDLGGSGIDSAQFTALEELDTNASLLVDGCSDCEEIVAQALATMSDGAVLDFSDNPALVTLDLAALLTLGTTTVGVTIDVSNCPALMTPILGEFLATKNTVIDFSGCALDVLVVDFIIKQALLSTPFNGGNYNSGSVDLSGGTTAAPSPTGAANAVLLAGEGITVTTN